MSYEIYRRSLEITKLASTALAYLKLGQPEVEEALGKMQEMAIYITRNTVNLMPKKAEKMKPGHSAVIMPLSDVDAHYEHDAHSETQSDKEGEE